MPYTISKECICCACCAEECPEQAITEGTNKFEIDPRLCTDCGICASLCPVQAISGPSL